MHWAWTYTIYNAVALIIWIHVEMRIGGELYYRVQLLLSVIAIFIIILALTPQVRKHYRKRKRIADPYYLVDSFD